MKHYFFLFLLISSNQITHSQNIKNIKCNLNKNEKIIIDKHLKNDKFGIIDINSNFKPDISKINYYRLREMDFNWEILKPISDKVTNYCKENQLSHRMGVKILNKEQKALYFWWYLDGQVTNGGFSQFIYNGYDKYFPAILKGLKLLPNKEYYKLVEKVYLYYIQKGLETIDRNKIDYFKNKFYEDDFLSQADSLYLKINDQLYLDFEKFIRINQTKFIQQIDDKLSGEIIEEKDNYIKESISLENGTPNGYYIKKEKDTLIEKIKYENGVIIEEYKYKNGILYKKTIYHKSDSTKTELEYYPNGTIKEENTIQVIDKYNWDYINQKKYFKNGKLSFEFWIESNFKKNIKHYFEDGDLQCHSKFWKNKENSCIIENEYIICFDENKKQILTNGNGIYITKENSEYGQYEDYIQCVNYKADGESIYYKNGIIWRKENYKNGLKDGIEIEYNDNGVEEIIRKYNNGKFIERIK